MNTPASIKDPSTRECAVCRGRRVEVLHHQRFTVPHNYPLPTSYDVVWCTRCGFTYADTPASQSDYDRYYQMSSKYEDNVTSSGGGGSASDRDRLYRTAAELAKFMDDSFARIADIGCANGGLLAELKSLGFKNLLGIDPSPACVENVRSVGGIESIHGSFRTLPENLGQFELVILSHVLEHVADLCSTLANLHPLLRRTAEPNGLLYIEVPDASRYADFMIAPFQDFNTEHINHFGPDALRNLLEANAFKTEHIGQKVVESSPGCPYPALFGFFRYTGGVNSGNSLPSAPDPVFREQILSYISCSSDKLSHIRHRIDQLESPTGKLIIWGTGQLTMKLLAETSLRDKQIEAFVDSNPINQGKELLGVPVIAPTNMRDQASPILIATLLHPTAIAEQIREDLRLSNPIVMLE